MRRRASQKITVNTRVIVIGPEDSAQRGRIGVVAGKLRRKIGPDTWKQGFDITSSAENDPGVFFAGASEVAVLSNMDPARAMELAQIRADFCATQRAEREAMEQKLREKARAKYVREQEEVAGPYRCETQKYRDDETRIDPFYDEARGVRERITVISGVDYQGLPKHELWWGAPGAVSPAQAVAFARALLSAATQLELAQRQAEQEMGLEVRRPVA